MAQTTNNDQVPIFCLANAIDVIKPPLIKFARDNLPNASPNASESPPSYSQATKEIAEENKRKSEIESVQSNDPDPDSEKDKAEQLAKSANVSGGATSDCSKQDDDFTHAAAKINTSKDGGLERMVKTVTILPGFFQGNIPYPNVGKDMNGETISISSIVAVLLLCNKLGDTRELPIYRHTFVSTTPMGPRSQNHIFSLFPLLKTDTFIGNAVTIEECFGKRPQNSQQYMFSKSHIRAIVSQTFPDETFPWFGFDSKQQKVVTDSPMIQELVTKSNEIFAELRSAARDTKTSGECQIPVQDAKTQEITGVYSKIKQKGLLPPWMKPGDNSQPPMLASGWGTPVKPSAATVEAFMCKSNLEGFLNMQETITRGLVGGSNFIPVEKQNLDGPASVSGKSLPVISNAVKDYISAYRSSFGSDVTLASNRTLGSPQAGGEPTNTINVNSGQRAMQTRKSGFIGNTKIQEQLGEKAMDWLNEINQKMIKYNEQRPGEIIERQYILEDIQMKVQVLALILAAVTGMSPTIIPKVSRDNIPGDPNLKSASGGRAKGKKSQNKTNKNIRYRKNRTYKAK